MPLSVNIRPTELYNSRTNQFIKVKGRTISVEHSLLSVSKWESHFHKPFLHNMDKRTNFEMMYYIRCMTLTSNVDDYTYKALEKDRKEMDRIINYIQDPMTATKIFDKREEFRKLGIEVQDQGPQQKPEIVTAELFYYYMFSLGIPIEFEKRHLNQLRTLIDVFSVKNGEANGTSQKMTKEETAAYYKALNKQRMAKPKKPHKKH